jgi:hypothetical protein
MYYVKVRKLFISLRSWNRDNYVMVLNSNGNSTERALFPKQK